ncbi:MAG: ABC transporter ATP-binding protein [Burkholderiales bacterium]|nr:ABC transporter ATP-binding protein [Burkholderiales bacterium]
MLAVKDLAFGFPGRTVGRDVNFALADGEIVCVLGPNGSGKTTLFRTLLGLLAPHGGSIALDGAALESLPRDAIARRIGYVPQAHAGYFAYSVREMVLMGRTAHLGAFGAPGLRDRERAEAALETLGIAALAERPFTEISGGERQLTLIARALAQEAGLLVMDEPTASLDFGNQVRVLERLERLAARGIAVLFSTHDPDHAFLCAQRALLIAEGRALALGPPREVIRSDTLERLYGVSVRIVQTAEGAHTCVPSLGGHA